MLRENVNRANVNQVANIILKVLNNDLARYYNDALTILSQINLSKLTEKYQKEIMECLLHFVKEINKYNTIHHLKDSLIFFRKNATIKEKYGMDDIVEKYMPEEYKEIYKLETLENDENYLKKYIKKCLNIIHTQNEEQGQNGVYKGFMSNEYDTIRNIIKYDNLNLKTEELEKIMSILIETLEQKNQTIIAKNSAIKLIIYLKAKFKDKRIWEKYKQIFIKNNEKYICGNEDVFLEKESILLMNFNMKLLYAAFLIKVDNIEIDLITTAMKLNDFEKIKALEYINYFLEENNYPKENNKLIEAILQYACIMCNEDEFDIRFWATKCLIQLTYSPYKKIALQQLTNIMNYGSSELKITILSRLKQISFENDSEFINFAIDKAKVDNNFIIRKIALEYNQEKKGENKYGL